MENPHRATNPHCNKQKIHESNGNVSLGGDLHGKYCAISLLAKRL